MSTLNTSLFDLLFIAFSSEMSHLLRKLRKKRVVTHILVELIFWICLKILEVNG